MFSVDLADRIYKSGGRRLAHLWPTHSTEFWAQLIVWNALKKGGEDLRLSCRSNCSDSTVRCSTRTSV